VEKSIRNPRHYFNSILLPILVQTMMTMLLLLTTFLLTYSQHHAPLSDLLHQSSGRGRGR
jgi:hypothetical protein